MVDLKVTMYEAAKLKAKLKTKVRSVTYLKNQNKVLVKFSSIIITDEEYCNIIVTDINQLIK